MKIGDAVAKAASVVVQNPCGGCRKAQQLMNSGDPAKIVKGFAMIPGNTLSILRGDVQGVVGEPFRCDLPEKSGIAEGSIPPGLRLEGHAITGTPVKAGTWRISVASGGNRRWIFIRLIEA